MSLVKVFKKVFTFLVALSFAAASLKADTIVSGSIPYTFSPGTIISSSQMNSNFDYLKTQINTNAAKNGVNSSITSLLGLTTPIPLAGGGSSVYFSGTAGGTANAITVSTTTPAVSSYTLAQGNTVIFTAAATNTAAATLTVGSTTTKNIYKLTSSGLIALVGGEIVIGTPVQVYYDGTQYVIMNTWPLFGALTTIASGATVDLGTASSHLIFVSGSNTITSFGSSADTSTPVYIVRFGTGITITHNGTSLITPGGADIKTSFGDTVFMLYLGSGNWRIMWYTPSTANTASLESVNELSITNNAGTPTTQVDVSASSAVLCNTSNYCIRNPAAISFTINAATTGANALDTGTLANNTWYYIYIISNGTTVSGLMSTSATAPTMPSGYVYKYRVGAVTTLGAATFIRFAQKGNRAYYRVVAGSTTPNLPIIASGGGVGDLTVPTWVAASVTAYVPTAVASKIYLGLSSYTGAAGAVAPNNAYGVATSRTNPPPLVASANNITTIMELESTNVYWATGANPVALYCVGWIDSVNAN